MAWPMSHMADVAKPPKFDTQFQPCKNSCCSLFLQGGPRVALQVTGRSGGIGRRAWFRSMYPQGCGGSSPFFGTIFSVEIFSISVESLSGAGCITLRICETIL